MRVVGFTDSALYISRFYFELTYFQIFQALESNEQLTIESDGKHSAKRNSMFTNVTFIDHR